MAGGTGGKVVQIASAILSGLSGGSKKKKKEKEKEKEKSPKKSAIPTIIEVTADIIKKNRSNRRKSFASAKTDTTSFDERMASNRRGKRTTGARRGFAP